MRSERLDIRLTPEEEALIRRAAREGGQTVSSFVVSSAREAAEARLVERASFTLDDEAWAAFQQRLAQPPRRNEILAKLMREPDLFE